jgi:hypothetical protein
MHENQCFSNRDPHTHQYASPHTAPQGRYINYKMLLCVEYDDRAIN